MSAGPEQTDLMVSSNASNNHVNQSDEDEEQYFTDPEDIIDLSRLSDSVIRVSPTPDSSNSASGSSAPSKVELLRSLSYLEAELQASDAAIAALRASKSRLAFYQAKYVRLVLPDTFSSALGAGQQPQQNSTSNSDSGSAKPSTIDEESQMGQLENLIDVQRKAHACMTAQLEGLRNKLKKASRDLIEERCKHEQDSAEGDDVLAGLGKERERLLNELEFERSKNRRQEKELKRQLRALDEVRTANAKQKAVALDQIRQRKRAAEQLVELAERCRQLEARHPHLASLKDPVQEAESAAAVAQRKVVELGRLAQSETAKADRLAAEVEALRLRLTATTAAPASPAASSNASSTAGALRRGAKPEPPVRRTPETPRPRPVAAAAASSGLVVGTPSLKLSSATMTTSSASRLPMTSPMSSGGIHSSPKRAPMSAAASVVGSGGGAGGSAASARVLAANGK